MNILGGRESYNIFALKKMQMITILKQNTSLQSIKYLYPIKSIHKTWTYKKNPWVVHMYIPNIWGVQ
jgi:hypothetical protein